MFTVYFAIFGGIAAVAFGLADVREKDFPLIAWARVVGFIVTLAFFLFEYLCNINARYYGDSVRALEAKLGYFKKPELWLRTKYVTYPLYFILMAFWALALFDLRDRSLDPRRLLQWLIVYVYSA